MENKCPFCNGEFTIQTSEIDGFEYVRNCECNSCHGVYRKVYGVIYASDDVVDLLIARMRELEG